MRTKMKGHIHDRISTVKHDNTARLMEKKWKMLLDSSSPEEKKCSSSSSSARLMEKMPKMMLDSTSPEVLSSRIYKIAYIRFLI